MLWRNISTVNNIGTSDWMDIHLGVIVVPLLTCSINRILPFLYFFSGDSFCAYYTFMSAFTGLGGSIGYGNFGLEGEPAGAVL